MDALAAMYGAVTEVADGLSDDDLMRPSRCAGWALRLVRGTLDGLLGAQLDWDDQAYALKGTGRMPLTDDDRIALGPLAARFPLFG